MCWWRWSVKNYGWFRTSFFLFFFSSSYEASDDGWWRSSGQSRWREPPFVPPWPELCREIRKVVLYFVVAVCKQRTRSRQCVVSVTCLCLCVCNAGASYVKSPAGREPRNPASRLTDCQDICHSWQSYTLPCGSVWICVLYICVCVCVCIGGRWGEGWETVIGTGCLQRSQEQPCLLNIHASCSQWQLFVWQSLNPCRHECLKIKHTPAVRPERSALFLVLIPQSFFFFVPLFLLNFIRL